MEYIEGRTLADAIASEQFPPEQTAALMAEIADAVNFANEARLVQRDLKPANVLLDKQGRPHVADFGLAIHEDAQRLRKGEIAGSPAYMAPEQVRGETHRLDGRTDQWSLGVILYEMLATPVDLRNARLVAAAVAKATIERRNFRREMAQPAETPDELICGLAMTEVGDKIF